MSLAFPPLQPFWGAVQRHYSPGLLHRNRRWNGLGYQLHHPYQIMSGHDEAEHPIHSFSSAQLGLFYRAILLAPTKHLLHQLPLTLTNGESWILPLLLRQPIRPLRIRFVFRHMGNDVALSQPFDKFLILVSLVRSYRHRRGRLLALAFLLPSLL